VDELIRQKLRALGAADCVSKPLDPEMLLRAIRQSA
jgi:hypothetical protein